MSSNNIVSTEFLPINEDDLDEMRQIYFDGAFNLDRTQKSNIKPIFDADGTEVTVVHSDERRIYFCEISESPEQLQTKCTIKKDGNTSTCNLDGCLDDAEKFKVKCNYDLSHFKNPDDLFLFLKKFPNFKKNIEDGKKCFAPQELNKLMLHFSSMTIKNDGNNYCPINPETGARMEECLLVRSTHPAGKICSNYFNAKVASKKGKDFVRNMDRMFVNWCNEPKYKNNLISGDEKPAYIFKEDCKCIQRQFDEEYRQYKKESPVSDNCWYAPCVKQGYIEADRYLTLSTENDSCVNSINSCKISVQNQAGKNMVFSGNKNVVNCSFVTKDGIVTSNVENVPENPNESRKTNKDGNSPTFDDDEEDFSVKPKPKTLFNFSDRQYFYIAIGFAVIIMVFFSFRR